jgi:uncharacterized membrane protein
MSEWFVSFAVISLLFRQSRCIKQFVPDWVSDCCLMPIQQFFSYIMGCRIIATLTKNSQGFISSRNLSKSHLLYLFNNIISVMINLIHCLFSNVSFLILPVLTSYIMYFRISRNMEDDILYLTGNCWLVHGITRHKFETRHPSDDSDQVWFQLV